MKYILFLILFAVSFAANAYGTIKLDTAYQLPISVSRYAIPDITDTTGFTVVDAGTYAVNVSSVYKVQYIRFVGTRIYNARVNSFRVIDPLGNVTEHIGAGSEQLWLEPGAYQIEADLTLLGGGTAPGVWGLEALSVIRVP